MKTSQIGQKDPLKIGRYSIFGAVVWTILLAFILNLNIKAIKNEALKRAYTYTQVGFEKDVLYRRWVAEHGGVYVKIDSATAPNPYLAHIPNRDLVLDSNIRLTLLNPAYMTRQVYELQEASSEVRGHITSLRVTRSENAPDAWETKALYSFEEGATEYSGIDTIDGKEYFRYMKPFITEESCLLCHAKDGYAKNDIRGGVSIAYPMSKVAFLNKSEIRNQYLFFLILWFLGIAGIIIAFFQLMKNDKKRVLAEQSLKELNIRLEEKVEQRSRELQKAQRDWQNIFNTLEIPAQLIDKNHEIKYVNDATLKVLHKKREDFIGQKCYTLFHLSDTPPEGCPLSTAVESNKASTNEMLLEATGTTYIVSCSPIYDSDGKVEHYMHMMTDITARKEMELKIMESKKKLDKRIKELGLLLEVSQKLIREKELGAILQAITDFATKLITVDSTAVYLVQEDQLYLGAATPTIPIDFPEEFRYAKIKDHPHIAKSMKDAKPLVIEDLDKVVLTEEENKIRKFRDFKTLLYIPLMIETRAVGVLILGTTDKVREFKKHELDLFITLSVQAALTIENALLYSRSVKYSDNLETKIQELTKAEKEIKKLNADLEKRIKLRTAELETKNADLERINKLFVGREIRMAELKKEIEKLKENRE